MNDHELKTLLASVTPPAPDEAARGRALHRATLALSQGDSLITETGAAVRPDRRVAYGWLAACGVALIAALVMVSPFRVATEADAGADLTTLAQVEELFPGRLNALIERDGDMRLDLAGQVMPGATNQPVLVQLERGGHRLRVLSYSGRSVTLELKGERFTFEALVTGDGGVVLSGDGFAWSTEHPKPHAGYKIQARRLNAL